MDVVGRDWRDGGIQEAITAAGTTLGRIHFPAGYYSLTTCINLIDSASGFGNISADL